MEYYSNNLEELKKINEIIKNAKLAKIYDKSLGDFIKVEKGIGYTFANKWQDLFFLECETWKIDMLYNSILRKIERTEKREKEIKYKGPTTIEELSKLKELGFKKSKIQKKIGYYIDHSDEFKKINEILIMYKDYDSNIYRSTPMEIYKKSYCEIDCDLTFPKEWNDLPKLNWTTSKLNELLHTTKIEYIKSYLSKFKFESHLDYSFYDSTINVNNYFYYKDEFDKYYERYKRLEKTKHNAYDILNNIDKFYSGNDKEDINNTALFFVDKATDMNAKSDFVYVDKYEEKFEKINSQIKKTKDAYYRKIKEEQRRQEERERREEERERSNMENRNNNNRRNNNSSFATMK